MTEIEDKHKPAMRRIAVALDQAFNGEEHMGQGDYGFFLAVFPFGENEGRFNYISNADRKDIVVLLKEMTAKFEGQPDDLKGTG